MTSKKKEGPAADPVVESVKQSYEENLTFFMSTVSATLKRYNEMLQTALPHNPKAVYFFEIPGDELSPNPNNRKMPRSTTPIPGQVKEPTSPLLRRPKLDPLIVADMEANAIQLLRQQSSVHHSGDFLFPKVHSSKSGAVSTPDGSSIQPVAGDASKVITAVGSRRPQDDKKHLTPEQLEAIAMPPLLLVQLRVIKQEARSLGKVLDQIHDWIALNIPMMKEEDNMGVAVMASVIAEVSGCISRVRSVYDLEASYVADRSELELKYLKAMDADSAVQALKVIDTDSWDTLEKGWRVLMRVVLMVHTTLARNMRILRDPRSAPKHHLSL